MHIRPATPADTPAIEALLDAAFGSGRHARTAAQLRRGGSPIPALGLLAEARGALVASIQYWPIQLVADGPSASRARREGDESALPPSGSRRGGVAGPIEACRALTLLGPLAVAPAARDRGFGRRLLADSLARADAAGIDPILLIGDASYYGPFGFSAAATGGWTLPGPVERERLLLRQRGSTPLPAVARVTAPGCSA